MPIWPMSGPFPERANGFVRKCDDAITSTRAGFSLFSGTVTPSPEGNAVLRVPSTVAARFCCANSPLGFQARKGLRSTLSVVSRRVRGVERATTRNFSGATSGCLSLWRTIEDENGKASAGMRKKPAKLVSSSCSSPVNAGLSCTSRNCGKRMLASPPWVMMPTRNGRPKSSTASLRSSMP